MIDNSNVFQPNDEHIIYCPSYTFRCPENLPAVIPQDVFEQHYKVIYRHVSHIPLTSNFLKFQRYYYQAYVNEIIRMKPRDDKFWLTLRDVILSKNIVLFDPKTIHYINAKLQHHK
jgi:hypothetical protein